MAWYSFRLTAYMMTGDFVSNISYTEHLQEGDLPQYLWQGPIVDALERVLKNDKHIVTLLSVHPSDFCQFNTLGAPLGLVFASVIIFDSHLRILLT